MESVGHVAMGSQNPGSPKTINRKDQLTGGSRMAVLKATGLSRVYGKKQPVTWALRGVDLSVETGDFIGVMGPSGSGKTTLLNLLAAIDTPTSGTVEINGVELSKLNDANLAVFRRRNLGFIFQDYNLLHTLSIKENVVLPLVLDNVPPATILKRLEEVSGQLGISAILDKRVFEVSGGEQQRAAIARAIIHRPALILADEPTGNLDSKSSGAVMKALQDLNDEGKATILLVTHDPFAASFCRRILFIRDGRIHSELRRYGDRRRFFQEILDALREQGGVTHDFSAAGV